MAGAADEECEDKADFWKRFEHRFALRQEGRAAREEPYVWATKAQGTGPPTLRLREIDTGQGRAGVTSVQGREAIPTRGALGLSMVEAR